MIALMIPAGRWIEPVNRRRALVIAVAGFAAASALAGMAPSLALLLAARAAQGGFGAVLSVSVLAIAAAVVHPSQRGQAMGVIAMLGPLGSVTGPGLGGLLVAGPGWRWIFFANVPICLLAVALAVRSVPSRGGLKGLPGAFVAESVTAGAAALALLLALQQATVAGWGSPQALALVAIALVAGCAWTLLPASRPTVRALGRPALAGQLVVLLAGAASTGAGYFLAAFFLQGPLRLPPSQAGAVLLVLPLSLAAAAQFGGRAADRFGTKLPAALGTGLILAGGLLLLPLGTGWGPLDVALRFVVIGLGSGLLAGPNQAAIMAATPPSLMGTAGGLSGLARTLGFALGPALAAVLWSRGELTAEAMRPAFALMVILPALVLTAVLVTPTRPRGSVAPTPASRRPEEDVTAAPAGWP
jgi:MFS family permease